MKKAVTLIELLVSLALLSVIILAVTSFNVTSSRMLQSSEKKTAVLNDLTFITEVIQKKSLGADGFISNYAIYPNPNDTAGSYDYIYLKSEGTLNAYYLKDGNFTHCLDYDNSVLSCNDTSPEILSRRVTCFTVDDPGIVEPFFLNITLTGRYNVNNVVNNSSNPQVIINTTIFPGQHSLS